MNTIAAALPHPVAGVTRAGRDTQWRFAPVRPRDADGVRDFIRDAFLSAYGARITQFLPRLHALHRGAELMAACGLRLAADEPLFLETYLDQPVEEMLAAHAGHAIERTRVVEVGNLSIARPGLSRHFIVHLTGHLHAAGMEWTVFTAVPALRNNFARLGIPVATLAPAHAQRVPADQLAAWGSYYEQGPVVCAVKVEDAHARLWSTP